MRCAPLHNVALYFSLRGDRWTHSGRRSVAVLGHVTNTKGKEDEIIIFLCVSSQLHLIAVRCCVIDNLLMVLETACRPANQNQGKWSRDLRFEKGLIQRVSTWLEPLFACNWLTAELSLKRRYDGALWHCSCSLITHSNTSHGDKSFNVISDTTKNCFYHLYLYTWSALIIYNVAFEAGAV